MVSSGTVVVAMLTERATQLTGDRPALPIFLLYMRPMKPWNPEAMQEIIMQCFGKQSNTERASD